MSALEINQSSHTKIEAISNDKQGQYNSHQAWLGLSTNHLVYLHCGYYNPKFVSLRCQDKWPPCHESKCRHLETPGAMLPSHGTRGTKTHGKHVTQHNISLVIIIPQEIKTLSGDSFIERQREWKASNCKRMCNFANFTCISWQSRKAKSRVSVSAKMCGYD